MIQAILDHYTYVLFVRAWLTAYYLVNRFPFLLDSRRRPHDEDQTQPVVDFVPLLTNLPPLAIY